jgi:hypothetical protein
VALFTALTPPAYTLPNNQEFVLALAATSLVNWTGTQSLTFVGIAVPGGNQDGMVVVFSNQSLFSLSIAHDSNLASDVTHRCLNGGLVTVTVGPGGALWYRFNGRTGRWHQLGRA